MNEMRELTLADLRDDINSRDSVVVTLLKEAVRNSGLLWTAIASQRGRDAKVAESMGYLRWIQSAENDVMGKTDDVWSITNNGRDLLDRQG